MEDRYDQAFDEIVFAVTVLLWGEDAAQEETLRRVIWYALDQLGVQEILRELGDKL